MPLGQHPGGADVINWTHTQENNFIRTGLNLTFDEEYFVSVKAQNIGGLWSKSGTAPGVIVGSGICPIADFFADQTKGPNPLSVNFTDVSTGTVSEWHWDFGDGKYSDIQNPTHVYTKAGVYTVSLLVVGSAGSDSLTKDNYIQVTDTVNKLEAYLPIITK